MSEKPSNFAETMRRAAIVAIALLPFSVIGTRLGLFDFRFGLLCFVLSAVVSIIIVSITAVATRKQSNDQDRRKLSQAAMICAIPVILVAFAISKGSHAPPIHDITTDLISPPVFIAAKDRRDISDNSLDIDSATHEQQTEAYPGVSHHQSPLTMHEALLVAAKTAESLNWKIYYIDEKADVSQFEAVDISFWFGFKDDIAVRLTNINNNSRIDLRSASRVGRSDLGVNAKRIVEFIDTFKSLEQKILAKQKASDQQQ